MDKTLMRRIVDKGAKLEIVDTDGNVVAVLAQWEAEAADAWREARLIAVAPLMLRCVKQFSTAMHVLGIDAWGAFSGVELHHEFSEAMRALGIDAELYDGIVEFVEGVEED